LDLDQKMVWWIVTAAVFTGVIIVLFKFVGQYIVKSRTAKMLAEHGADVSGNGENDENQPSS